MTSLDMQLRQAVRFGDRDRVRSLIVDHRVDPDVRDGVAGLAALHWAVYLKTTSIIDLLLSLRADVMLPVAAVVPNTTSAASSLSYSSTSPTMPMPLHAVHSPTAIASLSKFKGCTALHLAANVGADDYTINLLIQKRADVNALSASHDTPLHMAAENNHHATVQLLLAKQADINAQSLGLRTPLYLAAKNNHSHTVDVLLNKGADKTLPSVCDGCNAIVRLCDCTIARLQIEMCTTS
jgi:ankyrin repeat protein